MSEEQNESGGKVDATAILYIVGGIPTLVAFIVLLFWAARCGDIPA